MATTAQFVRFAVVGAAGFVVDAAALHLAIHELDTGLYLGRVISYLSAATATWALNRRFTFYEQRDHLLIREWSKFLSANLAGGSINYAVYALLVSASAVVAAWPIIGVAAGSMAGLVVNFFLSKRLVFNK